MVRFYEPKNISQVSTLNNGLSIKKSNIPNAGMGLFAAKNFIKNEYITYYDGEKISRETAILRKSQNKHSHIRSIFIMGECVDGYTGETINSKNGAASLVNDGRNSMKNNARLESRSSIIWLRANQDISKNEEILCSYGNTYWTSFNK